MAGIAPEVLVLCQESAFGTPVLTAGNVDYTLTSTFVVPTPQSNGFQADFKPNLQEIPFGGGFDVCVDVVASTYETKATFSTYGYPALTAFLLNAACVQVNSGGSSPWSTTEPQYDLASIAAFHAVRMRSGTVKRRKLVGGKISRLNLSCSRQDPRLKITGEIIFQKEVGNAADSSSDVSSTVFPLPADTNYPTGPYLFTHTASSVIYTASAITSYESIAVNVANKLDVRHFESAYPSVIAYLGRETTVQMDLLLKSSPNLRADYQAITSRAFSVTWNNGTKSSQISLGNSNHITDLPYDLPLGQQFMQKLSLKNRYNLSAGTDLAITNT